MKRLSISAILALVLYTVLTGVAIPAGASTGPNAYTANVCGAAGCGVNNGRLVVPLPLKERINLYPDTNPAHVGIQEACYNQAEDFAYFLRGKLSQYEIAFHSQITGPTVYDSCGGTSIDYGVASYVVGSSSSLRNTAAFPQQNPSDNDNRGYACIRGSIFGNSYWGCSAHMNSESSWSEPQFGYFVSSVITPRASLPVLWGGDFYVTPDRITSASPGFTYSAHLEADRCASTYNRHTFRSNQKYDYVFRSGTGRACGGDATLYPASIADLWQYGSPRRTAAEIQNGAFPSDHRIETGRW